MSPYCSSRRKFVFTLAEVFSAYSVGYRKLAFTLAEVFSAYSVGYRKLAFTLAEVFSTHSVGYRKLAFTLAEVLITLGIIGVVAALSMPTIINSTRNKELESQLKSAYSILQQGLSRMNAERGYTVTPEDFVGGAFYVDYRKYFNKIYDCGIVNPDERICMSRANTQGLGDVFTDLAYKTYNMHTLSTTHLDDGQFVLPNGMLIMIDNAGGTVNPTLFISVDVNGKNKKPNRWGHDLFTFQVMDNGKLLPMGVEGTTFHGSNCSTTSTHVINGIGCTYKALTEKDYFKNLPK